MQLKLLEKGPIYAIESAQTPSCHASTIVRMTDGRLAAAWFGGSNESNPDVCIWFSVREANGWTTPVRVTPDNNIAHWNPVLYQDPLSGLLWLFYKEGLTPRCWHTMVTRSSDCGAAWSEPEELVTGDTFPRGPVKDKLICLSDGTWLAPSSEEDDLHRWMLFLDRSEDHGKSWGRTDYVPMQLEGSDRVYASISEMPAKSGGLIQPTLWEEKDHPGHVHLLARSSLGHIYRADSTDFGKTWSCAYPTDQPNNNSGIDVVRMDDGTLALIFNPVAANWGDRFPISLMLSKDNGKTWGHRLDLETEPGEYSYPAIIADGDMLYMAYTFQRQTVQFAAVQVCR